MSSKQPRTTLSAQDPARASASSLPSTPTGLTRISRRHLENQSSKSSNSTSSSDSGTVDLSRLSLSPLASAPGTIITEPDETVEIPKTMESLETLRWLGLNDRRAQQIWKKWQDDTDRTYPWDFGHFARDALKHAVEADNCDTGAPDIDWAPHLRNIGANEQLVGAIADRDPSYDGVRLSQTAAQWVDLALDHRWEWLIYVRKASEKRGTGGIDLAPLGSSSPIQVHMQVSQEIVTEQIYDRDRNVVTNAQGQLLPDLPLWRGTSRVRAEAMWSGDLRTGNFNLGNQHCDGATDFSRSGAQYWTPDVEAAQMYAGFANKVAQPAMVCLIRLQVPRAVIDQHTTKVLRYPSEDFKRVVFFSRRRQIIEPKSLVREIQRSQLLTGDIATGPNERYHKMKDWDQVTDKCLMKIPKSDKLPTQYVFSHGAEDDDFLQTLNQHPTAVTIRKADHPNVLLPPIEAQAVKVS